MNAIADKVVSLPSPPASRAQTAGDVPLLRGLQLGPPQRQMLQKVHAAIVADFALRRRMLLRRCDVTVQSFLRAVKDKDKRGGGNGNAGELPPLLQVRPRPPPPAPGEHARGVRPLGAFAPSQGSVKGGILGAKST